MERTTRASDASGPGRLTPERLQQVFADLCAAHDFDTTDARLIKFTNSAVFDLPRAGLVIKIAGSRLVTQRIPKVITVARWLEDHDFPAVRLFPRVDQPVYSHGHAATVWTRVTTSGSALTGVDLARVIRRFHRLPAPPALPEWDPIGSIRRRLADADGADADTLAFLSARCDDLAARLADLSPALTPGPRRPDYIDMPTISGQTPVAVTLHSRATDAVGATELPTGV